MQLIVRDVANIFGVTEKTIYRWIKSGELPAYKVLDQYRFNRAELLEWATARRLNVSPALFTEPESRDVPVPNFSSALLEGGIYYRVGGTDKVSALRSVVETIRLPDDVDREFLLGVFLAREELASTGIGDGIAVPHVRSPVVLQVSRPLISLCFLEKPVDFAALDGRPVRALFTLISPTVRAHLKLLSSLSFALRDSEFKAMIDKQASRDEILTGARRVESSMAKPNDILVGENDITDPNDILVGGNGI